MRLLNILTTLLILILAGCKPADFKLTSPTASMSGSSKVNFDHNLFLNSSCVQCHENKRPVTIPAHGNGGDCISCHTASLNSAGVRSWISLTNFSHNPMPTSCVSCHENKRPVTLAPHMKGQWGEKQDCVSCHTHPSWKPAKFDHVKPLTSCVECHRSSTKDDRPLPKASHPSDFYNQIDCIQCHTNSTNNKKWIDTTFNHKTHTPTPADCMTCHEIKRPLSHTIAPKIAGMDKSDCKSCHTNTTDWKQSVAFNHEASAPTSCIGCHATSVPANQTAHPSPVGNYSKIDCVKCHTYNQSTSPRSWKKIIFNQMTHSPSPAACIECHKTVNDSTPKTNTHMTGSRSSKDCATCHKFDGVLLWTNFTPFNHIAIDANETCVSCHTSTNKTLTSKPTTHIATTLDCKTCHLQTAWKPATFTHSPTDTNCMSCHNGTTAKGKTVNHVPTTQQCNVCHTQTAWKPATFKHAPTDTNCNSCHNGTYASARATTHTLNFTNQQCSACHNQTAFKPKVFTTTYKHSSSGGMPPKGTSYHKSQSSCTKCHSSTTDSVIYSDVAANATLMPRCAGCHTSVHTPDKHNNRSVTTDANCLQCHSYNGW
jgi:hypothetical protein